MYKAEFSPLSVFFALLLTVDSSTGQLMSSCDFGVPLSRSLCGWTQVPSGLVAGWLFGSSCTPTEDTGPCVDHTGIRNGNFLYVESSYRTNGTKYRLNSPVFSTNNSSPLACLQFYYHMYGEDVGILNIYVNNRVLWTRTGQQGNIWLRADVNLSISDEGSASYFNISIEGVIINNRKRLADLKGDVAIDDISVTLGSCLYSSEESSSTAYPSTVAPQVGTSPASNGFPQHCNFEYNICGFDNKRGAPAWTRSNGSSTASLLGPVTDKTLNSAAGVFVLFKPALEMEARNGIMLISPRLGVGATCLSLFYYIFGTEAGSFNVYADVEAEDVLLWSTAGTGRGQWLPASIPLPNDTVAISLEGVSSSGDSFYIAVDELIITNMACNDLPSYWCDFGTALSPSGCGYVDSGGLLRWLAGTGCTFTQGTGPCADHTGNRLGEFRYIESSYRANGTKALLNSPILRKNLAAAGGCLQFYYHMYGEDIGTLTVHLNGSRIWSSTGERGNFWLRANVELHLSEATELTFQISFEAVILNNKGASTDLKGDIAIDDILVTTSGSCEKTSDTQPPAVTTATQVPSSPPLTDLPLSPGRQCDFESGSCGFFDKRQARVWTRESGRSVPGNQPSADCTYGNSTGTFMYYNGLSAATEGNSSILVSPRISDIGCLSFNYFISGASPCSLNVLIDTTNVDTVWWNTNGSERNRWIRVHVSLNAASGRISFEAVHESGDDFIIAIDDLELTESQTCTDAVTSSLSETASTTTVAQIVTTITDSKTSVASRSVVSSAPVTESNGSNSTIFQPALASGSDISADSTAIIFGSVGGSVAAAAALIAMWVRKKPCKNALGLGVSVLSLKYLRNQGQEQVYVRFDSNTYSDIQSA